MTTATLTFDLKDEGDNFQYTRVIKAQEMAQVLHDVSDRLRAIYKYEEEGYDMETVEKIRTYFRESLMYHNVDLGEL